MKRINIIKNSIVTNSIRLNSDQDCLAWKEANKHHFGRVEQYMLDLPNAPLSQELKDIALSSRQVVIVTELLDENNNVVRPEEVATEYLIPDEFTHQIVDAVAEVESEQALKFLNESDYKVLRHLGQKALNVTTTLSEQEYLDLEAERQTARSKVL